MKRVYSAGIIVFFKEDNKSPRYLLLHYTQGHWDLPKGKVEKGETIKEAALRELKEEASIRAILDDSFKELFSYDFVDHDNQKTHKTVIFFVGEITESQKITLSHEHLDYAWLPYEQALKKLTYQNAQEVVKKAERFLNN